LCRLEALGRGDEAEEDAIEGWLKAEFDAVVVVVVRVGAKGLASRRGGDSTTATRG
jgi:hypothetical protein